MRTPHDGLHVVAHWASYRDTPPSMSQAVSQRALAMSQALSHAMQRTVSRVVPRTAAVSSRAHACCYAVWQGPGRCIAVVSRTVSRHKATFPFAIQKLYRDTSHVARALDRIVARCCAPLRACCALCYLLDPVSRYNPAIS